MVFGIAILAFLYSFTSHTHTVMPYRALPDSDSSRSKAFCAASKKIRRRRASSPATAATLTALGPQWEKEIRDRSDALGGQSALTSAPDAACVRLRLVTSHFFQVYQLGVARGIFSPAATSLVSLPDH